MFINFFKKYDGPCRFGTTPEQLARLKAMADNGNLYMMQHSVAHRRIHDEKADSVYDQGFGATLRYDLDADAGREVTMCRFSPDGSKLFTGCGEIVMGGGYDGFRCSQLVYFKVRDQAETWKASAAPATTAPWCTETMYVS